MLVAGTVTYAGASLVSDHLLKPKLYGDALADNDVYQRVYSEVLTDPDVRDLTADLLGNFTIGDRDAATTASLSNALLRLALPPATLEQATEQLTANALAYLRGETGRLDPRVNLSQALARLDDTASAVVRDLLARSSSEILDNLPDYEAAVRSFADDLANGVIPTSVPFIGGRVVSESDILAVIDAAADFGLPEDVRQQVAAAVRSGEARDALITAASEYARTHIEQLAASLAEGGELRFDILDTLGERTGQPQRRAVAELNEIRDAVQWVPAWLPEVSLMVAAGGAVTLAFANRSRPRRQLALIGGGLLGASVLIRLGSLIVGRRFDSPLGTAAESLDAAPLPRSVSSIVADLDRSIGTDLRAVVADRVDRINVIGALFVAGAVVLVLIEWLRDADWRLVTAGCAIVALVSLTTLRSAEQPAPEAGRACNGHAELCERTYDTVVQAATHNSMSSPDVVRIWPEHDANIRAQLNFGIRTLLIDTKYWTAVYSPEDLSTFDQTLPADVANELFGTLAGRLQERPGTYLCHSRCAYGAIPFAQALTTVRTFLDANPNEVVTLIIQDGVSKTDTEEAFAASGADRYVYEGPGDDGWPTLGELIDDGHRLVVFSEFRGPPPAWYHAGSEEIQDTSFAVQSADSFSCTLNRGRANAPLFLMNHWVEREAPDRADALVVNARDYVVQRARACAVSRGKMPNFIAVNFFSLGDVLGAVDELNGVGDRDTRR